MLSHSATMTVSRVLFSHMADLAKAVAPSKSMKPALTRGSLRWDAERSVVHLTAQSSQGMLEIYSGGQAIGHSDALSVPVHRLAQLVGQPTGDVIDLGFEPEKGLHLGMEHAQFYVSDALTDNVLNIPVVAPDAGGSLLAVDFIRALKMMQLAYNPSMTGALAGVHLLSNGEQIIIESTDGAMGVRRVLPLSAPFGSFSFILSWESIKEIIGVTGSFETVDLAVNADRISLVGESGQLSARYVSRVVHGAFPNLDIGFDTHGPSHMVCDRTALQQRVDWALMAAENVRNIHLVPEGAVLRMDSMGMGIATSSVTCPITSAVTPRSIAVNGDRLGAILRALGSLDQGDVTMQLDGGPRENPAFVMTKGEEACFFLMPVLVQSEQSA